MEISLSIPYMESIERFMESIRVVPGDDTKIADNATQNCVHTTVTFFPMQTKKHKKNAAPFSKDKFLGGWFLAILCRF